MRLLPPLRVRFHITISALVLLVVVATSGLALAVVVNESWKAARDAAQTHFSQLAEAVRDRVQTLFANVEIPVNILAGQPQVAAAMVSDGRDHPAYPLFAKTVLAVHDLYSIYVANGDGDFMQVIATRDQSGILAAHHAPADTALIVRTILNSDDGQRRQRWLFLDTFGKVLRDYQDVTADYDPRQRRWYGQATSNEGVTVSPPYLFNSLKAPGVTASRHVGNGVVVGADLTLASLQAFLDRQEISEHGGIIVFDGNHQLMALSGHQMPSLPAMSQVTALSGPPFDAVFSNQSTARSEHQLSVHRERLRGKGDDTIEVAVFAPQSDFTGRVDSMRRNIFTGAVVLAVVSLALAWWLAHHIVRPVKQLAGDAERTLDWDFAAAHVHSSFIAEISSLSDGFAMMKRSLVETLERNPVGIVIAGQDGRVEYANPAYVANVGADNLAQVVGQTVQLKAQAAGEPMTYAQLEAQARGGVWQGEMLNHRVNGGVFWESVVLAPVHEDDGGLSHYIGVHQDISERRRHRDEMARLVEHLNDANAELERFAYVASHDLREPLRTVSTFLQLLQKRFGGQMGAEADEFIQFAVNGAQRMNDLVNDLLVYSRVGGAKDEVVAVDCAALCRSVLENLGEVIAEAGADIRVQTLPVVLGQPIRLTQVFQNLISNAVKFRAPGRAPLVQVSYLGLDKGYHHFSVADNGIGIEACDQDVFEVFRRLHGPGQYQGTGIGLAICKRVVSRHGGRIWYQANPDGGTVFHFTLSADGGVATLRKNSSAVDPGPVADRLLPG
ncbi:MAG: PAS domain-containing protein [Magnetospirillum gryphiswaldense]|nr:PAS domain-containing protein [Magnetospirillum gryphiswaldense]